MSGGKVLADRAAPHRAPGQRCDAAARGGAGLGRPYRLGQTKRVTVEYFHAEGSLDGYIARLLEAKIALINAVEAEDFPEASLIAQLEVDLRRLAPSLIEELRLARAATASPEAAVQRLAAAKPRLVVEATPIEETGFWEFTSERDPSQAYRVTYGRVGHLECTCKGFEFRGNCKHVREVRSKSAA